MKTGVEAEEGECKKKKKREAERDGQTSRGAKIEKIN